MKNRSWKTNLVALFGCGILAIMIVLVYLKTITINDMFAGLGALGTFLTIILGFLSKDKDVTGLPKS